MLVMQTKPPTTRAHLGSLGVVLVAAVVSMSVPNVYAVEEEADLIVSRDVPPRPAYRNTFPGRATSVNLSPDVEILDLNFVIPANTENVLSEMQIQTPDTENVIPGIPKVIPGMENTIPDFTVRGVTIPDVHTLHTSLPSTDIEIVHTIDLVDTGIEDVGSTLLDYELSEMGVADVTVGPMIDAVNVTGRFSDPPISDIPFRLNTVAGSVSPNVSMGPIIQAGDRLTSQVVTGVVDQTVGNLGNTVMHAVSPLTAQGAQ